MTFDSNPSIAPPMERYSPDDNRFGHGVFLMENPERRYHFFNGIDYFDGVPGPAQYLSNFYPSPFCLPSRVLDLLWHPLRRELTPDEQAQVVGLVYPTGEAAFQALKAVTFKEFVQIAGCVDPSKAKYAGRQTRMRPDWREVRVEVMRMVLAAKFSPGSDMAAQLLATGTAVLIEGNTWRDDLHGVCVQRDGTVAGENLLGILLTERRGVLRAISDGQPSAWM